VSVCIVIFLKTVKVGENQRQRAFAFLGPGKFFLQLPLEKTVIIKPGQGVGNARRGEVNSRHLAPGSFRTSREPLPVTLDRRSGNHQAAPVLKKSARATVTAFPFIS
jgi:hypothetical protein